MNKLLIMVFVNIATPMVYVYAANDVERETNVSLKSVALTRGYTHVQKMRREKQATLELPPQQFEAVRRTALLPIDLQRKLKNDYLGIDSLKKLWTCSHKPYKSLPCEAKGCDIFVVDELAYAKSGTVACTYGYGDPHHHYYSWIHLWQPDTGKTARIDEQNTFIKCLTFLYNDVLAVGGPNDIDLWDVEAEKCTQRLQKPSAPKYSGVRMQVRKIVAGSNKIALSIDDPEWWGGITIWHPEDGSFTEFRTDSTEHVTAAALAPDNVTCAIGTTKKDRTEQGYIELWDLRKLDKYVNDYRHSTVCNVNSVEFATSELVISASKNPQLDVYDRKENRIVLKHEGYFWHNLCPLEDTQIIASLSPTSQRRNPFDSCLVLIDAQTGVIQSIPTKLPSYYYPMACGPYNTIAYGSVKGEIQLLRPTLPVMPSNVDDIPLDAYACAELHSSQPQAKNFVLTLTLLDYLNCTNHNYE